MSLTLNLVFRQSQKKDFVTVTNANFVEESKVVKYVKCMVWCYLCIFDIKKYSTPFRVKVVIVGAGD